MSWFCARVVNPGRLAEVKDKKQPNIQKHFYLLYSLWFNAKNCGLPIFYQFDSCQNFPAGGADTDKWNSSLFTKGSLSFDTFCRLLETLNRLQGFGNHRLKPLKQKFKCLKFLVESDLQTNIVFAEIQSPSSQRLFHSWAALIYSLDRLKIQFDLHCQSLPY